MQTPSHTFFTVIYRKEIIKTYSITDFKNVKEDNYKDIRITLEITLDTKQASLEGVLI